MIPSSWIVGHDDGKHRSSSSSSSNTKLKPPMFSIYHSPSSLSSSSTSITSSSSSSFSIINLVSKTLFILLLFHSLLPILNVNYLVVRAHTTNAQKTDQHQSSHHEQDVIINRPHRFRNGSSSSTTIIGVPTNAHTLHFGARDRVVDHHHENLGPHDESVDGFISSRPAANTGNIQFVSNRVNVLDQDHFLHSDRTNENGGGSRVQTGLIQVHPTSEHRFHGEAPYDRTQNIGSVVRYDIRGDSVVAPFNRSGFTHRGWSSSTSDGHRFGHRTSNVNVEGFNRAASIDSSDADFDAGRDGEHRTHHIVHSISADSGLSGGGGSPRIDSTFGSSAAQGHRISDSYTGSGNHIIGASVGSVLHRDEHGRLYETIENVGASGGSHRAGGSLQNRVQVGAINRTLIHGGDSGTSAQAINRTIIFSGPGSAIYGAGGHTIVHSGTGVGGNLQNRVQVGAINRTFIQGGSGHQGGAGSTNRTVTTTVIHSGTGHQDRVQVGPPNRTLIQGGSGYQTDRIQNGGAINRTRIHHSEPSSTIHHGGDQSDVINRTAIIYAGPGSFIYGNQSTDSTANRTAHIHSSSSTGSTSIHSGHQGSINRTHIPVPSSAIHLSSGSGYQDRVQVSPVNRTLIHSTDTGGHRQDRIQTGSLNRTLIHSGPSSGILVGAQDRVTGVNRTNVHSGDRIDLEEANRGEVLRFDTRNRIDDSNTFGRIQTQPGLSATSHDSSSMVDYETRRDSINMTTGTGSATQLNQLDNVNVEAINKARIWAEQENELQAKKHAQNVVRLAATDQLESEIITNKTRAYLSCERGEMIVKINFTEPFRGVGYADYDRSSPCKFYGDGGKYYEMRLPLKGCGTKQEAPRIFINNIILRFHRSLELEEDEIKTIICRYPPPLAPPPPLIAAPILEQPPPVAPFVPAKLSELELLLIVSALLFLTLLLLGIGIGYYCLKKRKVKVVRKFVPPAEIPYFPPPSISSEEHSILSEQSIVQRDDYQFQNMGFIPEAKLSYLDDMFYHDQDLVDDDVVLTKQNIMAPPIPTFSTKKFDDRFITQASETDIDTDYEVDRLIVPKKPKITTLITDDYFVTPKTTTEIIDEVTTHRVIVPPKKTLATKHIDDTMITPQEETIVDDQVTKQRIFGPSKLSTQTVDDLYVHSESETEMIDDVTKHRIYGPKNEPRLTTANQDDYYRTDVYEIDEVTDDFTDTKIHMAPQPTTRIVQTTEGDEIITHTRDIEEFVDDTNYKMISKKPSPPMQPKRKPKITVQNIDDFYVTNITETETNEQITKIGRSMPNLTLQVDYEEQLEHDEYEHASHLTGFDVKMRTIPRKPTTTGPQPTSITTSETTTETKMTTTKIDEVLRVLENPPREKIPDLDEHFMLPTRNRLRQVILTDETFRTLIIESTTIEEYTERIQRHPTYGPMFEPPTWEVIFRLLSLPEVVNSNVRRRPPTTRTRYSDTYRSGISAQEVRSVTEEDVTFSRSRLTTAHFVPLPDYPMDDDNDPKVSTLPKGSHWASHLPDPKHFNRYSPEMQPIQPAFGTTGRRYQTRPLPSGSPPSSIFGPRRLENPYDSSSPSLAKRRMFPDYGGDLRPYSPDLDALSLEPSQTYLAYSGSIRRRNHQIQSEEREEIKSTTETNVYDWKRYH